MSKRILFILIFVVIVQNCLYSQYSNTLWYFYNTKLDFNSQTPTLKTTNLPLGNEDQFILTDCQGNLVLLALSYSGIYNRDEKVMKGSTVNQTEMYSNINGFVYPGSKDSIVIFHEYYANFRYRFGYSIVDMTKDSGRGEVVLNKKPINGMRNPSLAVIKHANGKDYWIIQSRDSTTAYSYHFSSSGLDPVPVVSKGYFNNYNDSTSPATEYYHQMCWAPIVPTWDSKQLIVTGLTKWLHPSAMALLYNFDNSTGKISNPQVLFKHSDVAQSNYTTQKASIAFNDTFIYFGVRSAFTGNIRDKAYFYQLNRFTMEKKLIQSQVKTTWDQELGYWTPTMAPDGKIYVKDYSKISTSKPNPKMFRVEIPNALGFACKYKFWKLDTFSPFSWTLPTTMLKTVPTYFDVNNQISPCQDTSIISIGGDTLLNKLVLRFGDGDTLIYTGPFKSGLKFRHFYKTDGKYPLTMVTWNKSCNTPRWFTDTLTIYKPIRNFAALISHNPTCFGDTVKVTLSAQNHKMFTANWGYPKPGGGVYDTVLYSSSTNVSFRFFYPESSVKYSVTFSGSNDFCGSMFNDSLTVGVYPKPNNYISLSQDSSCAGRILTVSDSGSFWRNSSISWFGSIDSMVGSGHLQKSRIIPNSLLKRNESILLKSVNAQGCELLDTLNMYVFPRPEGSLSSMDTIICALQQVFSASMNKIKNPIGTNWQMSDGSDTRNDTFWTKTYTQPGSYALLLTGMTNSGCSDSAYLNFQVRSIPNAGFKTNRDTLCSRKDMLELTSIANSSLDSISIQWYTTGMGDTIFSNTAKIQYPSSGQYQIKQFIGTVQGCFDTSRKDITVYPSPDATFHLTESSICSGQPLLAISDSTKPWDFGDWYIPALGIKEPLNWGSGLPRIKLNTNQTAPLKGNYSIMYVLYNFEGCRDTVVRSVKVYKKPTANFVPPSNCEGQESVFNSSSIEGDAPLSNVVWKIGTSILLGNVVKFTFSSIGNYPVTHIVQDTNNCADTVTKMAIVKPTPRPIISWAPFRLNDGPVFSYTFTAEPQGMTEYKWTFDEAGIMNGMQVFPSFNSTKDSLKAQLRITSGNGCKADTTIFFNIAGITGFYFPNAITVNNDGLNESFGIAGPEFIKSYDLQIYNKWGERVFHTTDPYKQWIPEKAIPGQYVYYCKVFDVYNRPKEVKGTVMLIK